MEARNGEEEEDEAFHRRSEWRWMPHPELLLTPAHLDSMGEGIEVKMNEDEGGILWREGGRDFTP